MVEEVGTSMIFEGKVVKAKAHIDCHYCGKVCEFDYEEILKSKEDIVNLKFPCCGVVRQMPKNPPVGLSRHQYFRVTFPYSAVYKGEVVK